jgi:phosphoglycolate phosphatase-like HAD superfamily hydrolase
MAYDAVVLDNDGVLVELTDRATIVDALDRTYREFGVEPSAADRDALWVGTSPERVRERCAHHGLDPERVWTTRDRTVSAAERGAIERGAKGTYADVDALAELDVPLGVASNNVDRTVSFVVDLLDAPVGTVRARAPELSSLRRRKPAPHLVERACADLGVAPAATLFVGDSASDVIAARRAGADAALLARPAHDPVDETDLGTPPTHRLSTLAGLPALVG